MGPRGGDRDPLTPQVPPELSLTCVFTIISTDGPWLDEGACPRNWTWLEGSQQTLKCEARGNPSPKVTCSRKADNARLPIGVLVTVTREMSGTYVCQATSSHGNVTREVSLTICECPGV